MLQKSFKGVVQTKLKFHPLPQAERRRSNEVLLLTTSVAGVSSHSSHCGELRKKGTCSEASLLKRKINRLEKGRTKKGFRSQFQIRSWFEPYLSAFQMSDFGPKGFMNRGTAGTSPHPGVHFTLEKQRTPSLHVCEKLLKKQTNKQKSTDFHSTRS